MPPVTVRRIGPQEGGLLRDLRLRSLRDAPEAFGQNAADAAVRPDDDWQQQARQASSGDRRAWFLAVEASGAIVGLVQGRRRPPADLLIFSLWVDPRARRDGVGLALMRAAQRWAHGWGATRTVLWVFASNEPAIRFYRRLGFNTETDTADAASGTNYGALAMSRSTAPDSD